MCNSDRLFDRLVIRGEIEVPQAMHVGSGEANRRSDATIRRDANGQPYIPGSSLGGLLRSTARDLAAYYFEDPTQATNNLFGCAEERGKRKGRASRVLVNDAHIAVSLPPRIEVRDHVGLDRRKGAARPRLQYNREVTPGNTRYRFEISIEDPAAADIGLMLTVLDFWSEWGLHVGGRTTTGLGQAKVVGDSVEYTGVNLSDRAALHSYLCGGDPSNPVEFLPEQWKITRADLDKKASLFQANRVPRTSGGYGEAFRLQHLFLRIALIPEEPLLVQAPVAKIASDKSGEGTTRVSDADFVTRAEKIVRTLNFYRGNAGAITDEGYRAAQAGYEQRICACAVTHPRPDPEWQDPARLLACFGTPNKQRRAQREAKQKAQEAERRARGNPGEAGTSEEMADLAFAITLYERSCVTCRLFGNTMMRGRLHVGDATLVVEEPVSKLFDHVAIDRFHGGAEDKKKFDTHPLMPESEPTTQLGQVDFRPMFAFDLHLERPEPWMLGLVGHLLKDLYTADLRVGHATHRGYGRVRGIVTQAELLVLPGSDLKRLCEETKLLSAKQTTGELSQERLGPYRRVRLELPKLFGSERWNIEGLVGKPLANLPTAALFSACDQKFQELVEQEEGRRHGTF
jgi:CRISPR/Cas system CSM-associated protein Csm3 (group 7 of RAMP superfamily)